MGFLFFSCYFRPPEEVLRTLKWPESSQQRKNWRDFKLHTETVSINDWELVILTTWEHETAWLVTPFGCQLWLTSLVTSNLVFIISVPHKVSFHRMARDIFLSTNSLLYFLVNSTYWDFIIVSAYFRDFLFFLLFIVFFLFLCLLSCLYPFPALPPSLRAGNGVLCSVGFQNVY